MSLEWDTSNRRYRRNVTMRERTAWFLLQVLIVAAFLTALWLCGAEGWL